MIRSQPMDPLVSIIVPTYKRPDMLGRALDSLVGQTYGNIEIIVISDNDPDSDYAAETNRVMEGYLGDSRVRFMTTSGHTGGGFARNVACREAHGDYLAFLDDDDEFLPDKVETQLDYMLKEGLDFCWQDVAWYNERGKLVEHRRLDHCHDFSKNGLLRAHLLTPICPTSTYMLKKSLFDRTDGFGEVIAGQDWWLILRCIEADARFGYMPEVHVRQYLHSGERLSTGQNKIEGENARYSATRRYLHLLDKAEIRYTKFRHNAVLAFASARGRLPVKSIRYAFGAFFSSPRLCVRKGIEFFTEGKQ